METSTSNEEPESSWSQTTTPTSDDIDEVLPLVPPVRLRTFMDSRPRYMKTIRKRREINRPRSGGVGIGVTGMQRGFSIPALSFNRGLENSGVVQTTTFAIVTSATSSSTSPWSSPSGFIEDEDAEGDDESCCEETIGDEGMADNMILPKSEQFIEDVNLADIQENPMLDAMSVSSSSPVPAKRPRGRPRKHPKPSPEDKAKVTKNRSKTGCITCRRRKKKCDEAKPGCKNCEKNAVTCEGYQPMSMWKSGREKAEEERCRKASLSTHILQPIITGVETPGDMMFFEHYVFRLSSLFTLEGQENNVFKDIFLPMAVEHPGLMHSILALASKHIDYRSPYGVQFLRDHPEVNVNALEERSQFHHDEAIAHMQQDISKILSSSNPNVVLPATPAQMLCSVLQTLSDPTPSGQHRVHLSYYQRIMTECPPEDTPAMKMIDELMQYHISTDELIYLPTTVSENFELPTLIVQPSAVQLLGVSDGLFQYMSQITNLRNKIRMRIQAGIDPAVDYTFLRRGVEIDFGIRSWTPSWPAGDSRDSAVQLYRYMLWVYLYRTIKPPKSSNWKIDTKLTDHVNAGIAILDHFGPRDPSQTLILAPAFVLGCAAFEVEQRQKIRKAIAIVKNYMEYRNSDTALEVLEEVWRLMDARDERSWDWQSIANGMGMDFLAT